MPRYFFNVHGETFATPDLVGRTLPDEEAARAEARAIANEVVRDELSHALLPDNPWVEILDGNQRAVAVIPVNETVEDPRRVE